MRFDDFVQIHRDLLLRHRYAAVSDQWTHSHAFDPGNMVDCLVLSRYGELDILCTASSNPSVHLARRIARENLIPCMILEQVMEGTVLTLTDFATKNDSAVSAACTGEMLGEIYGFLATRSGSVWDLNWSLVGFVNTMKSFGSD